MKPQRCPPAAQAHSLLQLPNVGPAMAADLRLLGQETPQSLAGADPYALYLQLCSLSGTRQDPCVLDVFISICHYLQHDQALPWWHFTPGASSGRPGKLLACCRRLYNSAP